MRPVLGASVLAACAALAACKDPPKATATTSMTSTGSSATATGIPVPPPSYTAAPIADAGLATPPAATGMLTQCRPIAAVRPRAEGPDLDAHGCPMKLRTDSEFTYTLNAAAMAKQKKGAGLCCYDEHAVR